MKSSNLRFSRGCGGEDGDTGQRITKAAANLGYTCLEVQTAVLEGCLEISSLRLAGVRRSSDPLSLAFGGRSDCKR